MATCWDIRRFYSHGQYIGVVYDGLVYVNNEEKLCACWENTPQMQSLQSVSLPIKYPGPHETFSTVTQNLCMLTTNIHTLALSFMNRTYIKTGYHRSTDMQLYHHWS
jgi:hypothetical protein